MECAERERLEEILRIAIHETAWIYKERERMAANQPSELAKFEEVVQRAEGHGEEARANYCRHIEEHSCAVRRAPGNAGGVDWRESV